MSWEDDLAGCTYKAGQFSIDGKPTDPTTFQVIVTHRAFKEIVKELRDGRERTDHNLRDISMQLTKLADTLGGVTAQLKALTVDRVTDALQSRIEAAADRLRELGLWG